MNETQVRALVPAVIIVVAIGVGAFFGVRYMPGQQGNGGNNEQAGVPLELSNSAEEKAPEPTQQPVQEVVIQEAPSQDKTLVVTPEPAKKETPSTSTTTPKTSPEADPVDDKLKNALTKAADSEDYTALGTTLAKMYKRYPEGKKEFIEIESRAYVKATSYLDQEKNVEKARAAAEAVYSKYPFGWRFKYLRVRVLERLGRDAFAAGDLASAEKHALAMLGMEFRPEGANLMADIYLKRIDAALAKGDKAGAQAAYEEIKDYEVSTDRRKALDERFQKILGL